MARWVLLPLLAGFAASGAGAVDLTFGAEGEAGWDSNVVNIQDGPSSWTGKVGPTVKLEEPQGDLTYTMSYRARYDAYYDLHQVDGWEHYANLNGSYRFSETTFIRFGNLFQFLPIGSSSLQNVTDISNQPVPGQAISVFGQNRVLLNNASATLSHTFSPLWLTELELSNSYYDPQGPGQVSSLTTVGQGTLLYQLERTDQIGLGAGVTLQEFQATNNQASANTEYYNVYGVWRHQFSPTLKLDVQAGPTLVDAGSQEITATDVIVPLLAQSVKNGARSGRTALFSSCSPGADGFARFDTCTANIPLNEVQTGLNAQVPLDADLSGGGTDLTYFASLSLTKEWETIVARLAYSRSASNQGGLSTSSVLDSVTGTVTWRPTDLWSIALTAIWNRRESLSEGIDTNLSRSLFVGPSIFTSGGESVTGSASVVLTGRTVEVQNYYLTLRVDRRISKRLSIYGSFLYAYQTQNDTFGAASARYDAKRVNLGLRYEFDPIQLF